jgi:hypothetical protein
LPATIPVTSLADSGPGTLRAAIAQADQDTTPDTITFAPGVTGTITLVSALPDLSHTLTIDGPGPSALTVARSTAPGTPDFGIFTVPTGADVTISGLTISGGLAFSGGGISNAGTLTVADSTISGNQADAGGGIDNAGTLTVTNSTISGNSTFGGFGGGIDNAGTLTVANSTISNNNMSGTFLFVAESGGGIDNAGTLTVTNSTISGNSASGGKFGGGGGGGIDNAGTLTVTNSTLSGNTAGDGGGIGNSGKLTITNSTISGNTASGFVDFVGFGGGIFNASGGTLTVLTSIFDDSMGGNLVNNGTVISSGHNLFSDAPAVPLAATDLINTDPLLGPLADNGGPTPTMALLPGSPAIDAGVAVPGVTTDQRGIPRPQGKAPDIGAFESVGFAHATIVVTSLADSGPGTLRAAITQAASGGVITTQYTITFAPSVTGTIALASPLPELSAAVTIDGPGRSALTVARSRASGTPAFRIFTVPAGAEVTISGLTISGGQGSDVGGGISSSGTLTVTDSTITGNSAGYNGGGGISSSGTVTVTDSTISGNSTVSGGGGISSSGTVTVTDSTISGNSSGFGGGIGNDVDGTVTVTDSTISGNSAYDGGGGIFNNGTVTVTGSALSGNSADNPSSLGGGGICNNGDGALTVSDSTFSRNSAVYGGGIWNNVDGTLTVSDSTFSGNSASGFGEATGGGIDNGGTLTVADSTLSGNSAVFGGGIDNDSSTARLTVTASILANNSGGNLVAGGGTVVSKGHNLFSDKPRVALSPTDLTDTDPLLGPLADNGGPTPTMALLPGSPAINAGAAVPGITADQRGVPRPQGAAPDIGAFELQPPIEPFVAVSPSAGLNLVGTPCTATATVVGPDLLPLAGVPVQFRVLTGPNAGAAGTLNPADGRTDSEGRVRFTYVGSGGLGTDTLIASATLPGGGTIDSRAVTEQWISLTVVNTNDDGPGSLREAIELADQDTAPDTITFAPSVRGTIRLSSALPALTSNVIVNGPGASILTVARSQAPGTPGFRIFTVLAGAAVEISGLTISGGVASGATSDGGGIYNSGTLAVTKATLSGNSAAYGGRIWNNVDGTLTVSDSTFSRNSAFSGGGIENVGALTVSDSTFSGNLASGFGEATGGGIDNGGTLTVTDSTISGNSAAFGGGGIYIYPYIYPGTLTVTASILANNSGGNLGMEGGGTVVSKGHNLFSDKPGVALNPTDLTDTDPLLGPLADNGGPTPTMALLPGSPAIDAGVTVPGVTADQRGVPRPQGKAPDIGAFESRGFTLAVVSGAGQAAFVNSPFPAPLVVSVTSAFGEPVAGGRVTFSAPASGPSARLAGSPATIGADGRASVTASANDLAGTYAVTAQAAGAGGVALTLTNNVPPAVVLLQRFGIHAQPTLLVLTFNRPMDAATAQDLRNYLLFQVGPLGFAGPHPQPIPITAAVYDPATQSVILAPRSPLALGGYYLPTVSGAGPHPVRDVTGASLTGTGTGGQPGDYIALVHGPGPWVTPTPVVPARAASAVPAVPRFLAQLRWRR